ncbi:TRAP-type mannitol/chloroaromatic compound transport system permease small subunit [Azospirillum agricola]|uniref:TRAP transporter small permease subunit n=1 Tax=Azospirillum agricola TaxID=1720247 RepID=UPI001AE4A6E6|nr:TRAP transporter small permease subunit [Azospirillum agricola]MBP2232887.1 TRAP-type mannitol/chloroaromatic compound transport system permease small subunit [Azospirillum agricola]
MSFLISVSRVVDAVNARIGKGISWLILLAILVSAVNAVVRKLFDTSSNSWLELQWVLFAAVFLLCSPWTLKDDEHIRIDIVNAALSKRARDGIDVLGHLAFLLPFSLVMMVTSWPFFFASYAIEEQSMNAGGLPQWPAKLLIPLGFTVLFIQGLSELVKRVAIMSGRLEDPNARAGGHQAAAEAEAERLLAVAPNVGPQDAAHAAPHKN